MTSCVSWLPVLTQLQDLSYASSRRAARLTFLLLRQKLFSNITRSPEHFQNHIFVLLIIISIIEQLQYIRISTHSLLTMQNIPTMYCQIMAPIILVLGKQNIDNFSNTMTFSNALLLHSTLHSNTRAAGLSVDACEWVRRPSDRMRAAE